MAGLLAVVGLIKITVALQLAGHPLLQDYGTLDPAFYVELAKRVAGGDLALGPRAYYVSPLYVYFLGAVFAAAGPSLVAARVAQAVLGTVGVGLAMATARRLTGRASAMVTGALLGLSGIVTFFEVVILQSALDPVLMALDGWLLVRASRERTGRAWMLAGLGLGLHALNRPNLLLAAGACAVAMAVWGWRRDRAWLRWAAALAAGAALAVAPVTIRNLAVSGEAVLISSHGGLNFYIGNHAGADGAWRPVEGLRPSIEGQATDARQAVSAALGRAANDGDVSVYYAGKALAWIRENPGQALSLAGRKALYLLNAAGPSLNYSYSYYRDEEATWLKGLVVGPWLLIPLGLAGLGWAARRGEWIWVLLSAGYAASVVLFFVSDRYQLPLLVPAAVAGGGLVTRMWAERGRRAWMALGAVAVVGGVTNLDLGLDRARAEERGRMALALIASGNGERAERLIARSEQEAGGAGRLHYEAGLGYAKRRAYGEAERHLRRAAELMPARREAELALGQVLVERGRPEEALTALRAAAEQPGLQERAALEMVKALAAAGRWREAAGLLEQAPASEQEGAETLLAMGALGLQLRQPQTAARFFEAARRAEPGNVKAAEQLAVARGLGGDLAGAARVLQEAIRRSPGIASLHLNLGVTYAQGGRLTEARGEVEEALRLRPEYPQAEEMLGRLLNTR